MQGHSTQMKWENPIFREVKGVTRSNVSGINTKAVNLLFEQIVFKPANITDYR